MKNFCKLSLMIVAASTLGACTTQTTYEEPPYEHRTAGEGERLKDRAMHDKDTTQTMQRKFRKKMRK